MTLPPLTLFHLSFSDDGENDARNNSSGRNDLGNLHKIRMVLGEQLE
jgi:hypothetical protein